VLTRNGYDWSDRYPLIVEAARKLRTPAFVIDGEAVWLDADGKSDFDKVHSHKHDAEVRLVVFDLLSIGDNDIRPEPLHIRKGRLTKLLAYSSNGIQRSEHLEGPVGPRMFEHACRMDLRGSCRSTGIVPTEPGPVRTGSR
jgi:ATP-dependent DNA ligase